MQVTGFFGVLSFDVAWHREIQCAVDVWLLGIMIGLVIDGSER